MDEITPTQAVAFAGSSLFAHGSVREVALQVQAAFERDPNQNILVFDRETSRPIELDLRGSLDDIVARAEAPAKRTVGRPKLGVVAREVTLLPRHWDWLQEQPGGASVALRKLVDQARHASVDTDRARKARDAAYRFLLVMGGDRPGFEEATRTLFAGDLAGFREQIEAWPADIRDHLLALADGSNVS
jgi:hypothetical protein